MGHLRLTVGTKQIELKTSEESKDDEAILAAMKAVAAAKDEELNSKVEELKTANETDVQALKGTIAKLRVPLVADIVSGRLASSPKLDAAKETKYFEEQSDERLLSEFEHWANRKVEPNTTDEELELDAADTGAI